MEKVLKCNVFLNDLKDYAGMNEVYQGKFGAEPPVRTTIAAARRHPREFPGGDRRHRLPLAPG
jgi:enamine deaminase RidA (YjgF/YER057c/UK114 family)